MSKGAKIRNGGRRTTESEKAERRGNLPGGLRSRRWRNRSKYLANGMLFSEARKKGLLRD